MDQKEKILERLKLQAKLAVKNPNLRKIAMVSTSPTNAQKMAEGEKKFTREQVLSCWKLRKIKKEYFSEKDKDFEKFLEEYLKEIGNEEILKEESKAGEKKNTKRNNFKEFPLILCRYCHKPLPWSPRCVMFRLNHVHVGNTEDNNLKGYPDSLCICKTGKEDTKKLDMHSLIGTGRSIVSYKVTPYEIKELSLDQKKELGFKPEEAVFKLAIFIPNGIGMDFGF